MDVFEIERQHIAGQHGEDHKPRGDQDRHHLLHNFHFLSLKSCDEDPFKREALHTMYSSHTQQLLDKIKFKKKNLKSHEKRAHVRTGWPSESD